MIEINYQEKDLEDYLCKKENLEKWFPNLVIVKRQFQIFDFYIDILAYDKLAKCFVIIELKKDELNANAFVQALRYKNCLESKYLRRNFYIILLGKNLNSELFYCIKSYDPYDLVERGRVYYYLYNYSFEEGINFHYINTNQIHIQTRLQEIQEQTLIQKKEIITKWSEYNGNIQEN